MAIHKEIKVIERTITCKNCGSDDVSKNGKYKDTQYYICKSCNTNFAGKDTFPKMRYSKEINIKALTYYYNGMSYRNINHTFNDLLNISVPKMTLWRWVIKYSKLVNNYTLSLQPTLSDIWIADETVIDIWGTQYWFWDIIDTKTRFLIASHLSKTRSEKDATKLFYMAKLRSKTRPKTIITDKLYSYLGAFNRVFYSNLKERRVEHLLSEGFYSDVNTNLLERFHGTIKQRTKVMRDLKLKNCARITLDGFITHYNFFMEHEYLGTTPAIAGNIGDGIHNWGDLIDLALTTKIQNPKEVMLEWEEEFHVE